MGRSSDAGGSAAVLVLPVDFLAALHSPVLVHDQGRVEERPGRRLPGLLVDDEVRPADGLRGPGWILVRRRHLPEQVADIELFDADRERIRAHFLSGTNVRIIFLDQSLSPYLSITIAQTPAMLAVLYVGRFAHQSCPYGLTMSSLQG